MLKRLDELARRVRADVVVLYCMQSLLAQVSVSFCTRLLSLACTFTDYMYFTQLQTDSICQTVFFVPKFLPHLYRHRLQGPLDWLRRMMMVLSPEPTPRCTHDRSPHGTPAPRKSSRWSKHRSDPPVGNLVTFQRSDQYHASPTLGSTGASVRNSTDSSTPSTRSRIVHVSDSMQRIGAQRCFNRFTRGVLVRSRGLQLPFSTRWH